MPSYKPTPIFFSTNTRDALFGVFLILLSIALAFLTGTITLAPRVPSPEHPPGAVHR